MGGKINIVLYVAGGVINKASSGGELLKIIIKLVHSIARMNNVIW